MSLTELQSPQGYCGCGSIQSKDTNVLDFKEELWAHRNLEIDVRDAETRDKAICGDKQGAER